MDNLRSHVKTVHHGKAGMKRLVVAGSSADEGPDGCAGASTSESDIKIVTVTSEDIVTLATSAVAQLTGEAASSRLSPVIRKKCFLKGNFNPRLTPVHSAVDGVPETVQKVKETQ